MQRHWTTEKFCDIVLPELEHQLRSTALFEMFDDKSTKLVSLLRHCSAVAFSAMSKITCSYMFNSFVWTPLLAYGKTVLRRHRNCHFYYYGCHISICLLRNWSHLLRKKVPGAHDLAFMFRLHCLLLSCALCYKKNFVERIVCVEVCARCAIAILSMVPCRLHV